MKKTSIYKILGAVTVITYLFVVPLSATENPKEWNNYWVERYGELQRENDTMVERAYEIFNRVLKAAGKRPGIDPKLVIIKSNNMIALSIPDDSIILSKKVLDFCYKDQSTGDDRLAFVLGHEIAHHLKDDFWHMKFFLAIDLSKDENSTQNKKVLDEVKDIATLTEKVLFKEMQADEYGIIYASMAGFNTNAIVNGDNNVSFFEEWERMLDPSRITGNREGSSHPNHKQRAATAKVRLKLVLEKVDLFNLGLLFYQTGDFKNAILAFKEFLTFFASREVYNNLAASHHQQALKYYRQWKSDDETMPFKLSMAVDPYTRAYNIKLRRGDHEDYKSNFHEHLQKAIEFYGDAIESDPFYVQSYNNLACAYIIKGDEDSMYEAVPKLKKALKMDENFNEARNNLGIAFYYIGNKDSAREILLESNKLDPTYNAPVFNLGMIASLEGKDSDADKYWSSYLKLDTFSLWAETIRKQLQLDNRKTDAKSQKKEEDDFEKVMDITVAAYDSEVLKILKETPTTRKITLEGNPFKLASFKNGLMTVSKEEEVVMIIIAEEYREKSTKGIAIGSSKNDILSLYGAPSKVLNMSQWTSFTYNTLGIAFQIRDDKVISWLLF